MKNKQDAIRTIFLDFVVLKKYSMNFIINIIVDHKNRELYINISFNADPHPNNTSNRIINNCQ